jgi:hypothetical protein
MPVAVVVRERFTETVLTRPILVVIRHTTTITTIAAAKRSAISQALVQCGHESAAFRAAVARLPIAHPAARFGTASRSSVTIVIAANIHNS